MSQEEPVQSEGYLAVKDILGLLGSFFVVLMFSAPLKNIIVVLRSKNTDSLITSLPYFATFCNCFAWCCYTIPELDNYVMPFSINLYGAFLSFFYSASFWYYTTHAQARLCGMYTMVGGSILLVALCLQVAYGRLVMGYIAATMNIVMLYAPLAAASEVIATKSVEKFPFWPLVFSFFGAAFWTAYGIYTSDPPIAIPNGSGVLFGIIQLGIYYKYKDGPPQQDLDLSPISPDKLPSDIASI